MTPYQKLHRAIVALQIAAIEHEDDLTIPRKMALQAMNINLTRINRVIAEIAADVARGSK